MIRILAFVLAIVLCCGFLIRTGAAIADTSGEVTFTETVRFGDPSVLDGRVARFDYLCDDHMLWQNEYRFGPEDSWNTEFSFIQDPLAQMPRNTQDVLEVYMHSGMGTSTSGGTGFELAQNGHGDMIRAVAAQTPNGTDFEMNLKMKDYVDYHTVNFMLDYTSDRYTVHEQASQFAGLVENDSFFDLPSYESFHRLFRFPVQEDEIASITVAKSPDGAIVGLYFNMESQTMIDVYSAATDDGVYCIPVYRSAPGSEEVIPGEYAQGMGLYFIPWKAYDDGYTYANGRQRVMMDADNAKNILPLPEDTAVYGLMVDEVEEYAWVLTLEDGIYVLNRLSLSGGGNLRLELMKLEGDGDFRAPTWYRQNGLMLIYANRQIALVTEGKTPEVELCVPVGEAFDGFYYFQQETGAMLWENGVLYLMDNPHFAEYMNVMVYDKTGLLYWGEYRCSLFEANRYHTYPYLEARYEPMEIQ